MSKIFFNSSEKKQKIINFIKKHKDILGVTESDMRITDEYLDALKNASNKEFFRLVNEIKLKFGRNFYIFSYDCYEKHSTIEIWLPTVLSKITSDKAIKEFCGINSFKDVIEKGYCSWYNMTPKRWKTFEAIFALYDKQKKTVKKTAKKTVKTVFTISEQKQKVINFIKKHKDILGVTESGMNITAKYLEELKNASNTEFFRLANKVRLKFGCNFYIFTDYCNEKHRVLEILLPDVLSKITSDKAIKEFCGSNSIDDVIGNHSSWYNMTPKRWKTFEAIFDFYDNTSLQTG